MSKEKFLCKNCNKSVEYLYEGLCYQCDSKLGSSLCKKCHKKADQIIDGLCRSCKFTSQCKNCSKEFYNEELNNDGFCRRCEKNKNSEQDRLASIYKLCPFCGESIKMIAIKCRFCNEMLNKKMPLHEPNNTHNIPPSVVQNIESKNNNYNSKKKYIIIFLLLILPPIAVRGLYYSGQVLLSGEDAVMLSNITKILLLCLTVWFANKLRMNLVWSLILGIGTLLPFGAWVTFIILLFYSPHKS